MTQPYKTTRIWLRTLQTLKRIAAETGESIVAVIDRLATAEWHRIRTQDDQSPTAQDGSR